ncbi:armadillo repeat-containing protein 3 isoform X2 [Lethenteron reissneri]|uniref:armadillo repeat-containing protein 3 isoform X2 n=1 Tax=Lethenteron reissneri TaxID=7753 RepID=UPI002AB6B1D9|nr:armadillo repeat-containing protein 3 isoform X2 [Lethenteron reissneri]
MGKKVKKAAEGPPKDAFEPLPIESRSVATVVLMLRSPEPDVLAKACDALHRFADKCEGNRAMLMDLGAVEPLASLLTQDDKTVRRNAIVTLGTLASNVAVRKILLNADVVSPVLKLLSPEEEVVCHEYGSLVLACLAQEFNGKAGVVAQGGTGCLVRLLTSHDPDVQKNAVECLSLLAQDTEGRLALHASHAVPPLLDLLASEFPVIQKLALDTLVAVARDGEGRGALRQGLDRVVGILSQKEWMDLHAQALQVFTLCLGDVETMRQAQGSGTLETMLSFVTASSQPDLQAHATRALAHMAGSDESWGILHEQGVEAVMVALLGSAASGDAVRSAAAHAVAAMSQRQAGAIAIHSHGELRSSIPPPVLRARSGYQTALSHPCCRQPPHWGTAQLVRLLSSESADVRETAVLALANLTSTFPDTCGTAAEGVEALLGLLAAGRLAVQAGAKTSPAAHAAVVLANLAGLEHLVPGLLASGAVEAIAALLSSPNPQLQGKAALALAGLMCRAEARAQLRIVGGLAPLVQMLDSNTVEIRRTACWVVFLCAADEPTAMEICRLGGLEVLQRLNESETRRSRFSETALARVLDSNLPLKYSRTGRLSAHNTITDGFYDAGPSEHQGSLEELARTGPNRNRAVLLVNTAPAEQLNVVDPLVEKPPDPGASGRVSSLQAKGSKTPSKTKTKGRKEEERAPEEEEAPGPAMRMEGATIEQPPWQPTPDPELRVFVEEAIRAVLPLACPRLQAATLARLVSDRMGGPVERDSLSDFSWELHVSQLKNELQSNLIPLGRIQRGVQPHRALLFKVVADRLGVPCSLVRGPYNHAWNELLLPPAPPQPATPVDGLSHPASNGPLLLPPQLHVVDLIHNVGALLHADSAEASNYTHL